MNREVSYVKPETTLAEAFEVMFKARYHDAIVEKDGVLQGIVRWDEIVKVKPEQRNELRIEKLQVKQVSVFQDESILEAQKIMNREKIDLVPVVEREHPDKAVGVLTSESIALALEKAKSLR